MLICREQQNPIVYKGRRIRVSDRALNAHFKMCNLPVSELEVSVYLGSELREDKEHLEKYTDEQLALIVEEGIKDEFLILADEETWKRIED